MSRKDKVKIITKQYILDQLADNEVDLSMNELSTVPIKELAQVTRGTKLDLSRNHLRALPDNFGNLRHLISLDLSSNKLQNLPSSFGNLVLLQKLDLYSNQLVTLPLSFWQLKKLKWLDLKNNPLEPGLREAAGTCVSSRECNQCATKVLAYMRQELSKSDKHKQNILEKQRENDRLRKEQEMLKKGLQKKEKELRMRLREEQLMQQQEEREIEAELENAEKATVNAQVDVGSVGKSPLTQLSISSICTTLLLLSVLTILLIMGGIVVCNNFLPASRCQDMRVGVIKYLAQILELLGAKVD